MNRNDARAGFGRRLAESLLLVVALLALVLGVLAAGSSAVFSGTVGATGASSGIATLGPIAADAPGNRLGVAAMALGAGDVAQRVVDIRVLGSSRLARVTLTTRAAPSSRLDTDRVNGLRVTLERCPVRWIERRGPGGGALAYSCPTRPTLVLPVGPVILTGARLGGLALTAGAHNYLRVSLTLGPVTPKALQGQFSTIHYAFTAQ